MSFSESGDSNAPIIQSELDQTEQTQETIEDVFHKKIQPLLDIETHYPTDHRMGRALVFEGQFKEDPKTVYQELSTFAEVKGFTIFLQRTAGKDQIVIVDGILMARRINPPWWLHLLLLLITLVTTIVAGSVLSSYNWESVWQLILTGGTDNSQNSLRIVYRSGRQFALPLLLILGVHEMGHYIAARLHGVKVTLPFFIPLPLFGSLGTMGAVILIKSPFLNRKQLFDVGIAGPLAGLFVAIGVFLYGLNLEPNLGIPLYWIQTAGINRVNVPLFLETLAHLVWEPERVGGIDRSIFYNYPTALAGWFGIFLTSLNLLPLGQYDGGHIIYAIFGRRVSWAVGILMAITGISLGIYLISIVSGFGAMWLIWVGIAILTGLRHPPPQDDISPLGLPRIIIGIITMLLFFTMIVIVPFYSTF